MDVILVWFAIVACLLLYALIFRKNEQWTKNQLPPGPKGLSVVVQFIRAANNFTLHYYAERWAKQYGDITSVTLFNTNIVFLNDARLMKLCFCEDSSKLLANDRPNTFASDYIFKNQSISFSQLGPLHSRLRKILHGCLKTYGEGLHALENTMLDELTHVVREIQANGNVNMDAIISKSLLNVIHMLLTNQRADYDGRIVDEMMKYNTAVNRLFGPEVDMSLTALPCLRHLPGPFRTKCNDVSQCAQNMIRIFFNKPDSQHSSGPYGLIQAAFAAKQIPDVSPHLEDQHIKTLALEIISAGYLTTKGILVGIILAMMERPHLQDKLYGYIEKVVGNEVVSLDKKAALPYIEALVMESTRYLSHGPLFLPHCAKQDFRFDGYHIPQGSLILVNLWFMGHNERVWDKPWEFRPERFLDEDGQLLPPEHPIRQQYFPFGIGRRQCPGESFAKSRLFLFIATLFQHFKFLPPEGETTSSSDPRTWTPGIILLPSKVLCRVELRDTCPLLNS